MPLWDCFIIMGMGSFFIIFGLATLFWGKHEEKSYFNSISTRPDVREYLEHWPERPQPGALKIGGWTAIAIGLLLVVMGGAFWLWG